MKNRSTEGIMIYTTGRVPTSKALKLAKRYGLKLICKAWPDSFFMKI